MSLSKKETTLLNEFLIKLEKEAIAGNSTLVMNKDFLNVVNDMIKRQYKLGYDKGYKTGTKAYKDDWQYDAGDSRG